MIFSIEHNMLSYDSIFQRQEVDIVCMYEHVHTSILQSLEQDLHSSITGARCVRCFFRCIPLHLADFLFGPDSTLPLDAVFLLSL